MVLNAIVSKREGEVVVEKATSLFTKYFFTLLKTSSAGVRSGLYGGKNRTRAPVCEIWSTTSAK